MGGWASEGLRVSLLDGIDQQPPETPSEVAAELHRDLVRARPHQQGLGGCFFLVGAAILVLAAGLGGMSLLSGTAEGLGAAVAIGGCYGTMGLIYAVPAALLLRAAAASAPGGDSEVRVLESVRRLKRFWQVLGVGMALIFVIQVVAIASIGALTAIGLALNEQFNEVSRGIAEEAE